MRSSVRWIASALLLTGILWAVTLPAQDPADEGADEGADEAAEAGIPAQQSLEESEELLSLAALLISDGHWDRAEGVLLTIDEQVEGLDRQRYHGLRGLTALQRGDAEPAAEQFQLALEHGAEPLYELYLAQALYALQRPAEALAALDRAGDLAREREAAWLLRVQAAQAAARPGEAWSEAEQALQRFPESRPLKLQQLLLLVDLGLYQEALAAGEGLLLRQTPAPLPPISPPLDEEGEPVVWSEAEWAEARAERAAEELRRAEQQEQEQLSAFSALGEALRRAGRPIEAAQLFEQARLLFPDESDLDLRLAAALVEAERPLAAGLLLERAAALNPALALEAAECFRRAERVDRALAVNLLVPEPAERYRQRLGLLLESERYHRARALVPRLSRAGLLLEDEVAHAVAYALFREADYQGAEELLGGIEDPDIFQRSIALREAIQRCQGSPEVCG